MIQNDEKIVVTGMGAISPAGYNLESLWESLENGDTHKDLFKYDNQFGHSFLVKSSRVNNWDPKELLGKRGLQFLQSSTKLLLGASTLALQEAKIEINGVNPNELGIVVGSNFSGMKMTWNYDYTAKTEGPKFVSPMQAPNTLGNSPASHLAIRLKARAFNTTLSTGQCAGLDAIGYAARMLRRGLAKYVVVGGTEELNDEIIWYYQNAGLLSDLEDNNDGLPFSKNSKGIVPGEGAAALILERQSNALERNAFIHAEVSSWSSSYSSKKSEEEFSTGLKRATNKALAKKNGNLTDVKLILSGANGLPLLDTSEAIFIRDFYSEYPVRVRTYKHILGEMSGASGIFQIISSIGVIKRNKLPKNFHEQDNKYFSLSGSNDWSPSRNDSILLTSQDLSGTSSVILVNSVG